MSKSTKYTKELIEPVVASSISLAEVMKKLGIKWSGGQQQNIKKRIASYGLDTSHFLGQAANRGDRHKGGTGKKRWSEVLVLQEGKNYREHPFRLRRALIESGREYKCSKCGNPGEWLGAELRLQVDHKNRNWSDNRPENLEFICPNCHSQTPGWSNNQGKTSLTSDWKSKYVHMGK